MRAAGILELPPAAAAARPFLSATAFKRRASGFVREPRRYYRYRQEPLNHSKNTLQSGRRGRAGRAPIALCPGRLPDLDRLAPTVWRSSTAPVCCTNNMPRPHSPPPTPPPFCRPHRPQVRFRRSGQCDAAVAKMKGHGERVAGGRSWLEECRFDVKVKRGSLRMQRVATISPLFHYFFKWLVDFV